MVDPGSGKRPSELETRKSEGCGTLAAGVAKEGLERGMEGLRRTGIAALKNGACRQRNPSGFCNSVFLFILSTRGGNSNSLLLVGWNTMSSGAMDVDGGAFPLSNGGLTVCPVLPSRYGASYNPPRNKSLRLPFQCHSVHEDCSKAVCVLPDMGGNGAISDGSPAGGAEGSWLTGCGEHEVRATIVRRQSRAEYCVLWYICLLKLAADSIHCSGGRCVEKFRLPIRH